MGQQYLIDSNAVIDYLSGKIPEKGMLFMNQVINDIPNISVITKIEVLGYKTTPEAYQLLSGFVDDSVVIGLTDDVVNQTIEIRKEKKRKENQNTRCINSSHSHCKPVNAYHQ